MPNWHEKTPVSSLILKITLHQWWGHNVAIVPPIEFKNLLFGESEFYPARSSNELDYV